jgi:hypothetical protein
LYEKEWQEGVYETGKAPDQQPTGERARVQAVGGVIFTCGGQVLRQISR